MHYQVKLDPPDENGTIVVHFPDFEWGVTQGDNEEEALNMAADVIEIYLEDCIKSGRPIPKTKKRAGHRTLRVPALVAAKAELHQAFLDSGMKKADLAKKLGIPRMNVDRLFDLKHQSRLDQIENAFRTFGQEMEIAVHPCARTPVSRGRKAVRIEDRGSRRSRSRRAPKSA